MTHFVRRICKQLVPRISSGLFNTSKEKTITGFINLNKYVHHPFICCKAMWMSTSAHSESKTGELGEKVKIYFKLPRTGEIVEAITREGQCVMNVAVGCNINMEGACEGAICCTTCHVYVEDDLYDRLPESSQAEEDMIDSAPFHKLTSRLSCQIVVTKDMEGAVFELPPGTQNMQVDKNQNRGFQWQPSVDRFSL